MYVLAMKIKGIGYISFIPGNIEQEAEEGHQKKKKRKRKKGRKEGRKNPLDFDSNMKEPHSQHN